MLRPLRTCAVVILSLAIVSPGGPVRAAEVGQRSLPFSGTVVDESGKPVAGAEVSSLGLLKGGPVRSAADGSFRLDLPLNSYGLAFTAVLARGEQGKLGLVQVWDAPAVGIQAKVVLKAPKVCEVRVVDGQGKPIAEAEVRATLSYFELAAGQTDAQGRWSVAFPSDAEHWGLLALRSKVGFDYATSNVPSRPGGPAPIPGSVRLSLDGARAPYRIKAVSRAGKPVAGVEVGLSYVRRKGRGADAGSLPGTLLRTDASGIAVFDWLPADMEGGLMAYPHSEDWSAVGGGWVEKASESNEHSIPLVRRERLSGRVTTADGRPAPGVTIKLNGQAGFGGGNPFSATAYTDEEGRYEVRAAGQHAYVLTATRGEMAAPYKAGVIVKEGQPTTGVDFVLGTGTRLKGQVLVAKGRKPVPGTFVRCRIEEGEVPALIRDPGNRNWLPVYLSTSIKADKDGRYEFVVGPGRYTIEGPEKVEPIQVTVPAANPPSELVHDRIMPRLISGPFALTVVDEKGRPVADARVEGVYLSSQHGFFRPARTDARGRLAMERTLESLTLGVFSADRTLGTIRRIDEEAAEAKVELGPTARAKGRLLDSSGQPLAGEALTFGVRVFLGPPVSSPFVRAFGATVTTDKDGRWEMAGLVPGEPYDVSAAIQGSPGSSRVVARLTPEKPGMHDLGEVKADLTPSQPYKPPTAADRTRDAFAAREEKTPEEKLSYTLVEAKCEYTRPLLLFGKPKDPASIELFRLFNEFDDSEDKSRPKTPADLRWEFELASLDVSRPDAKALAKRLSLPNPDSDSPRLAVLSDDGTLSAVYPLELGKDGKLDPKLLVAFLQPLKPPTRDAESMLKAGLATAKEEDKRLFLICSASWCGPCRLLARFLESHKAELSKHYVFVKLDISRDTHAQAVAERYQGKGAANGVPWYAILDPSGTTLATSNAREAPYEGTASTNIGFPSSRPGIAHFLEMLRSTAPRLTEDVLTTLKTALESRK